MAVALSEAASCSASPFLKTPLIETISLAGK
jgi:hypothetical protein